MAETTAKRYPNINRFVFERGWIEIGFDDSGYSYSFVKAHDPGGTVWEGEESYDSLDEALADLDHHLGEWMKETYGGRDST